MDRPLITLTTDFGTQDGFVGAMKGVILSLCPTAELLDITHDIQPQNVRQAALVLLQTIRYYPSGTIHLSVVDPGVGSERKAIALASPAWTLIGPDNGLLHPLWLEARGCWRAEELRAVELTEEKYFCTEVSPTFHGRDLFAPVAGHLASGKALGLFGPATHSIVPLELPRPEQVENGIRGEIQRIDRFGNCITNIPIGLLDELGPPEGLAVRIEAREYGPIRRTYSDVTAGQPLALVGSSGTLELALRDGDLATVHHRTTGEAVLVSRSQHLPDGTEEA